MIFPFTSPAYPHHRTLRNDGLAILYSVMFLTTYYSELEIPLLSTGGR